MYETTVNQLVTVAVFLVLQSIQLAGYLFGVHSALNSDFPLFVSKDQEPGAGVPVPFSGRIWPFLRPYNAF